MGHYVTWQEAMVAMVCYSTLLVKYSSIWAKTGFADVCAVKTLQAWGRRFTVVSQEECVFFPAQNIPKGTWRRCLTKNEKKEEEKYRGNIQRCFVTEYSRVNSRGTQS